ncbi:MAG: hypothetical protein COB15_03375 [Flavobacteriales bacterium]|nr:MAG: hypothetical protein COB15_03375 [Flavobacteriales bacterium]
MFSKDEKKQFNSDFWNSFGLYMKKYNNRYGRLRWVNYRSNVKDIFFRLSMTPKEAIFSIEIQHNDDDIRELFYEQFLQLKTVLESSIGNDVVWEQVSFNQYDSPVSKISVHISDVSIYNKDDWKKTFQFYEKRMVGLHEFWEEFKEVFKQLED